jgi:1-acyl-sn-glycerol-3-phosphate acyltransferase
MKNKNSKTKYKKPNSFVYGLFYAICKVIGKLCFNLKILRNETKNVKENESFVVLANHEASIDFIPVACAVRRKIHFVISNSFYETLPIKSLMSACGVLPKNQFQTMVEDLKKMKLCIENGMPVAIFPAGLMTADGVTTPIPTSTGKSLKWFDKDVYIAKSVGSYLTCPKWSKKMRKGQITVDVYKFMSKEEIRETDEKEIQRRIEKELYFNAYENQLANPIKYKGGNDIRGFENVLYKCPNCKTEYSTVVEGKSLIKCTACKYQALADNYGFLNKVGENEVFKLPNKWFELIESELKEEIVATENYKLTGE